MPSDLPPDPARRLVVAIDGPSGSGKSTVSRRVAERLGLAYLDTGAIYRALTWWCLERGVDLVDLATTTPWSVRPATCRCTMGTDPADPTVQVAGQDVAAAIREPRISAAVSTVATNLDVRAVLRDTQRQLMANGSRGVVAEGRDITTVIAPDADVRILLTADTDARLARRAAELHGRADAETLAATRDQVVRRDRDDSTVSTFLTAADGVRTIDSSSMSLDEVVDAVLAEVAERTGVRVGPVRA